MSSVKPSTRILVFHPGGLPVLTAIWHVLRCLPADTKISLVAPWHESSLSAEVLAVDPFDIQQREFLRLMQTPGPSALSPAIAELLANADTILTTLETAVEAFSRNLQTWAPKATIIPLRPNESPSQDADQPLSSRFRQQVEKAGLKLAAAPSTATPPPSDARHPPKPLLIWTEDDPSSPWSADGPLLTPLLKELDSRQEPYRLLAIARPGKPQNPDPAAQSTSTGRHPPKPQLLTIRNLSEAVPVLREARALLSPNHDLAHLADALGLPTIIFQASDEPPSPPPASGVVVKVDARSAQRSSADPIAEILAAIP